MVRSNFFERVGLDGNEISCQSDQAPSVQRSGKFIQTSQAGVSVSQCLNTSRCLDIVVEVQPQCLFGPIRASTSTGLVGQVLKGPSAQSKGILLCVGENFVTRLANESSFQVLPGELVALKNTWDQPFEFSLSELIGESEALAQDAVLRTQSESHQLEDEEEEDPAVISNGANAVEVRKYGRARRSSK